MEITLQTKIADLLDKYPHLEDTLIELSPAFAKLRNPILRRTVAKFANIQQAAQIGGISAIKMIQVLRKAVGLVEQGIEDIILDDENQEIPPTWFDINKIAIRFDARPIIDAGQSPMQEIIKISASLKQGEIMELSSPFKPVPIIDILKSRKFSVWYKDEKTYISPN